MIRAITSARGKPAIEDKNHYRYVSNGGNNNVSWFRCKDRKCKATISVRKTQTNWSVPQHNHGNGLMMSKVKTIEKDVIEKYAAVNQLDSFNKTFKSMTGKKPNVVSMLSLVKSQEAESNAVGRDLCDNHRLTTKKVTIQRST